MSIAFVCAMQDEWADDRHDTAFAMVRCAFCDEFAVAGYECETCGHEDIDPPDRLVGHGPGKCIPGAAVTSPAAVPPAPEVCLGRDMDCGRALPCPDHPAAVPGSPA